MSTTTMFTNPAGRDARSKKLLLIFAMVSMGMMFAGLTSAFVVSKNRADWLKTLELPQAFYWSTCIILLSSATIHWAKISIQKNQVSATTKALLITLILGIAFVLLQFNGFNELISKGYYFAGSQSTITTTFIYTFAIAHLVHLFSGVIVLLIVIYNHFKQKYSATQSTGIELAAMYWHFLDFLWVYLFLFLYFFR
ncbi:MAG: cytochrome oxidase subunit III [Flavobacterium sp. BFFFF2]|nr:MAG: cytochrome oxidase subunit III [Flavobacterium sp. BFFFF2]